MEGVFGDGRKASVLWLALCRLVLPDHRRVHHVCPYRTCDQGASCATPVHVWLRAQGGTWSSIELPSGRRAINSVRKVSFFPHSQVIETIMLAVRVDAPGCIPPSSNASIPGRSVPSRQRIVMGSLFGFCNGAAKGGQVGPE